MLSPIPAPRALFEESQGILSRRKSELPLRFQWSLALPELRPATGLASDPLAPHLSVKAQNAHAL